VIELTLGGSISNGSSISRRDFLKLVAAAGTVMTLAPFVDWAKLLPRAKAQLPNGTHANNSSPANPNIRPFHVNVPEAELTKLRRRINATRWPSRELVADRSQGVQLATLQALARIGQQITIGARPKRNLNALPQFITKIDGVDIHFIHVRSRPLVLGIRTGPGRSSRGRPSSSTGHGSGRLYDVPRRDL
jgi:Epoxide hydrolase N terminus